MKRTMLLLCVLSVLSWTAGSALAQGKGKEREGKTGNANKAEKNVPAAEKKATSPQDVEKAAKEKGKGAMEQAQTKGKSAKQQATEKMAETKGKGKDQAQQLRALDQQIRHEAAKHMERQARLARIKELALKKGDAKMIEQVDKLIAKENQLYAAKLEKMQAQKRAGGTMPPTTAPQPGPGKGKGKAEKPAGEAAKPPETKPEAQTPPPAAESAAPGGQAAPAPAPTTPPAPAPTTPPAAEPNAPKPQ
jgi:hypothetical protein